MHVRKPFLLEDVVRPLRASLVGRIPASAAGQ
jgi:hypothetical protein